MLDEATAAWLVRDKQRWIRISRSELGSLRQLLRLRKSAHAGLAACARRVTLTFERACRPSGTLWIDGNCTVRLLSWSEFADVEEPAMLAAWLAAHGVDEPLRALERAALPRSPLC